MSSGNISERRRENIVLGYIYHEKQVLGYCAKHSLNALFQREEYTIKELDQICKILKGQYGKLKLFNPHRSILPIGNYDINVIMWALDTRGKDIQWFDNRHLEELDTLDIDSLFGIIINKGNNGPVFSKHWYTLRPVYKSPLRMTIHETKKREPINPSSPSAVPSNDENSNTNVPQPPGIPYSNLTSTTKTTKANVTVDSNNNYYTTEDSPTHSYNNVALSEQEDDIQEDYEYNWWNLDSRLSAPVRFVSKEALLFHLRCQIVNGSQVLLIYNK